MFELNIRKKLEASIAKRMKEEEDREAQRLILPELPQKQAGRESDRMQRDQV